MRRLIEFIIAHSSIFVFVIYITISIILLLCFNPYHQSIYFSSANRIVGRYYTIVDNLTDYIALRQINQELQQYNTMLQIENTKLSEEIEHIKTQINISDFDLGVQKNTTIFGIAHPINVTISNTHNYITINKGSEHGVEEGMGVVNRSGVVGIVSMVSSNYSLVIPIINPKLRLSCKLKSSGYFGSLVWDGASPEYARLEELPQHVSFNKGDTIITSGYSSVFPEGIMVGTVEERTKQKNSNFFALKIKLSTDYFKLGNVCIIDNPLRKEQIMLEKEVEQK